MNEQQPLTRITPDKEIFGSRQLKVLFGACAGRRLAEEVPPGRRAAFLERFERVLDAPPPANWDERILTELNELKRDISRRIVSIEDGSYYEEEYREYSSRHYDYEDDGPDELSEEQRDGLEAFFQDASLLFLSGNLSRARYARCVYETTPLERRVSALMTAMYLEARLSEVDLDVYENDYPMFRDVIEARSVELPDQDVFLPR